MTIRQRREDLRERDDDPGIEVDVVGWTEALSAQRTGKRVAHIEQATLAFEAARVKPTPVPSEPRRPTGEMGAPFVRVHARGPLRHVVRRESRVDVLECGHSAPRVNHATHERRRCSECEPSKSESAARARYVNAVRRCARVHEMMVDANASAKGGKR